MEINSPEEFVQAVNTSLAYMNRAQRKAFIHWVHTRVRGYNFNYPNGMPQSKETTDVNNSTSPSIDFNKSDAIDATIIPEGRESGIVQDSTD